MASVISNRESIVEDFVTKLQKGMDRRGYTPVELAKLAGVGYPYLYRVLNGKQKPSMAWADKVGKLVGLRIRIDDSRRSA